LGFQSKIHAGITTIYNYEDYNDRGTTNLIQFYQLPGCQECTWWTKTSPSDWSRKQTAFQHLLLFLCSTDN